MNELIPRAECNLNPERLEAIESRIRDNLNRYAESVIDIGRCLNQAKDEKLVPHGQWVEWVKKNTGMGIHTAQRLMRAAREIPADSPLAKLSFSKVHALLALPSEDRESFAEEADAANKSVRELQAAIDAKLAAERARQTEENRRKALESENARLHGLLENPPVNPAAQAEIDRLHAEMDGLEEELEARADAEQKAKNDLLALQAQVARGTATASSGGLLSVSELQDAAESFEGRLYAFLHMRTQLAGCTSKTRAQYREVIEGVAALCRQAQAMFENLAEVIEV